MTIITILMGTHLVVNGLIGNTYLEEVDCLEDIKRLDDQLVKKYLEGELEVSIPHLPEGEEQVVCLLPDSSNWLENTRHYGSHWANLGSKDGAWWDYMLTSIGYCTNTFSIPVASNGINDWKLYTGYQEYFSNISKGIPDIQVCIHYDTPDVLKLALINWATSKEYPVLYWDGSSHQEVNI